MHKILGWPIGLLSFILFLVPLILTLRTVGEGSKPLPGYVLSWNVVAGIGCVALGLLTILMIYNEINRYIHFDRCINPFQFVGSGWYLTILSGIGVVITSFLDDLCVEKTSRSKPIENIYPTHQKYLDDSEKRTLGALGLTEEEIEEVEEDCDLAQTLGFPEEEAVLVTKPVAAVVLKVCENCGQTIGKLETPNVWNDHIVCAACYKKLA